MIAGQSGKTSGHFNTTAQVVYRYDTSRKTHHDNMWTLWKANPLLQNRINQFNALVFGRGIKWVYDDKTKRNLIKFAKNNKVYECPKINRNPIKLQPKSRGHFTR